ncbi:MAG: amidohydrolase family protein, partial [Actinomycetota bacterium]
RNYPDPLTESGELVVERTRRVRDRWHGHDGGRIRVETAPLIPWGCTDDAMRAAVGDARTWGAGTHIHCAETAEEVRMSLDERGVRHVTWLDDLGLLGPDVQLAHSVWLDDEELDLIAARDAVVVHCPVSNMYLASGVPRILDMRARGIRIALASDGPGSNNRQDMFEVLKAAVLLQKVHHRDPVALQPEEVITMACRGGAAALGLDDVGTVTPGALADLLVVSLQSVFTAPVHRVPSALVFCATPADISHVLVGGRLVIDEGDVVGIDEAALVADAAASAADVFRRAGVTSRLTR